MRQHFGDLAEDFVADLVAMCVVELLEEVDVHQDQGARRALALPFAESAFEFVVEGAAIRQAGQRIGAGLGFVGFDFDGLGGKLFLGLLEPLLQLGVRGDHLIHRAEHGRVGAVGFAVDAGQVGGDRLHLGGVVADVAGDVFGQIGDAAGGHGGPLGSAFRIFG